LNALFVIHVNRTHSTGTETASSARRRVAVAVETAAPTARFHSNTDNEAVHVLQVLKGSWCVAFRNLIAAITIKTKSLQYAVVLWYRITLYAALFGVRHRICQLFSMCRTYRNDGYAPYKRNYKKSKGCPPMEVGTGF
jgi:hypothetical protein